MKIKLFYRLFIIALEIYMCYTKIIRITVKYLHKNGEKGGFL